jgi:hypothetical protein
VPDSQRALLFARRSFAALGAHMSWSTIRFGEYWAHAHDIDQILFMSLATEFLDSSVEFRGLAWLQEWKTYWLEHKETMGNGCGNIDLPRFLCTAERVVQFRRFLCKYQIWLQQFGSEIPVDEINRRTNVPEQLIHTKPCGVGRLLDFAATVEDTLNGNLKNASVSRMPEHAQQSPAADAGNPRG